MVKNVTHAAIRQRQEELDQPEAQGKRELKRSFGFGQDRNSKSHRFDTRDRAVQWVRMGTNAAVNSATESGISI